MKLEVLVAVLGVVGMVVKLNVNLLNYLFFSMSATHMLVNKSGTTVT